MGPLTSLRNKEVSEVGSPQEDRVRAAATSFGQTYKTAEELVAAFVREAIVQGIYGPGERLQQDVIADVLGISRIPLRAGLRQLEEEGLLGISPHRGAVVTALHPEEIREIYELRAILECYLLEHAFAALSPERLAALRASVVMADSARTGTDPVESRMAFYEQLYSLANRPRALRVVSRLHREVNRYLLTPRVVEDPSGHLALLRHLENGNLDAAKRWLRRHLAEVSTRLEVLVADSFKGEELPDEPRFVVDDVQRARAPSVVRRSASEASRS